MVSLTRPPSRSSLLTLISRPCWGAAVSGSSAASGDATGASTRALEAQMCADRCWAGLATALAACACLVLAGMACWGANPGAAWHRWICSWRCMPAAEQDPRNSSQKAAQTACVLGMLKELGCK